jgi:Tfp pilus assembly protein PilE
MNHARNRQLGQGMTEYIIIVALIAIGAIAVYTAFGDVVRGQTSVAAAALSGDANPASRNRVVQDARQRANDNGESKDLADFETAN